MDEKELMEVLQSWENLELISKRLRKSPKDFATLMTIALRSEEHTSWRAAYLADKIHEDNPELLQPYLPEIIEKLEIESNASKKRHWLRAISMNEIEQKYLGFLFNYCIEILSSQKEAIAVRANAMQILYNISEKEHELKAEVLELIEHELAQNSSAGIRSRGTKLATKLRHKIRS